MLHEEREHGRIVSGQDLSFADECNRRLKPVTPLEPIKTESTCGALDTAKRFGELRALRDGWLEGDAKAPSQHGLNWLEGMIRSHYPDKLPSPYIYPVPDGGIQLEWSLRGREISLEVDLESKLGEWHSLDLDTKEEELERSDLATAPDWSRIVDRLRQVAGARQ
jgi:hypothetical protein